MEKVSQWVLLYVVNAAWQIPVIFMMAALCSLLLRRVTTKYRHGLWVAALIAGTLLPMCNIRPTDTPALPDSGFNASPENTTVRVSVYARSAQRQWLHVPRAPRVPATPAIAWTVAAAYAAFLIYRIGRFGLAWRHTVALSTSAHEGIRAEALQALVEPCSRVFGLKRMPAIFVTGDTGPVTIGARRPIVLLPAALVQSAPEAELMSAICHELAHIRRHDFAWNLFCELIYLPVSFHPVATLIKARVGHTRELACDEMAAGKLSTRASYARSLVSIASSMLAGASAQPLSYGQGLFDTRKMEERIMNLISTKVSIGDRWGRVLMLLSLAALAAASIAVSAFAIQAAQPLTPKATQAMQSLDASGSSVRTSINEVTLIGGSELPNAQELLATDLRSRTYDADVAREAAERTRMFYQENGYFYARITDTKTVSASPSAVNITLQVNAGRQYRLKEIQFTGNTLFPDEQLRSLFPLQPGELFRPGAIRTGLDAMRRLYRSRGYTEFAPTPEPTVNDAAGTVLLTITINAGSPSPQSPSVSSSMSPTISEPKGEQDLPGYYKVGGDVSAPKPINAPDPKYDPQSRALGVEGTAVFRAGIGLDGRIKDLRITESDGLPQAMLRNAEETLRTWTFEPARKEGEPVPVQIRVEVNFRLH